MKILAADYILLMDRNFTVLENGGVVFDEKIIDYSDDVEDLKRVYQTAEVQYLGKNSVLLPGFINSHVHLEFSANKTTLNYGSFMTWLDSVMENRDELMSKCGDSCMELALANMLKSGVTSLGAISSFGKDMEACVKTPQKVVYFSELIGSSMASADALFADFKERVDNSMGKKGDSFFPAVAIHSPYSVHPIVLNKGLEVAKENTMPVSAHFMESPSERKWLDSGTGEFKAFFQKFLNTDTPVTDSKRYLDSFDGVNVLFTHCVNINDEELSKLASLGATVVHCPVSNRLLGVGKLDLEKLKNNEIPFVVGTDGLSSNTSLSILDEIRTALMVHTDLDLNLLAKDLLKGVTSIPARSLGLNCGEIKEGLDADLISFILPDVLSDNSTIASSIILHLKEAENIFINGEKIKWNF
ncbi:MAG: metal-dependent hydrolase [Campylobacterales bacterium]|nr:metal-dependent hydrolase [Campylobacterales bacterium]